MGFSKVLGLKYKIIDYHYGKPSCIIFEDNITYNKKELDIVAKMDDATKVEIHKIKKCFNGMLESLHEVI